MVNSDRPILKLIILFPVQAEHAERVYMCIYACAEIMSRWISEYIDIGVKIGIREEWQRIKKNSDSWHTCTCVRIRPYIHVTA